MPYATIENGHVTIDGQAVQILSGAMHYFRVHPDLWADRLDKAVALGLNTIETYFCWNLHEPAPGQFDFSGGLDFNRFLALAAERGLYVIARPGPYICSEWENGGLPGWITSLPNVRLRVNNEAYMDAVERYFSELMPRLRRHLYANGGNVIAIQVENEYGSYGCDKSYLARVRDLMLAYKMDAILFTSDGDANHYLNGGICENCFITANFGSDSNAAFDLVRTYQPQGPDFCMEWWLGWFDHWGELHHVRKTDSAVKELETMLQRGANLNMYMFHGGTNFGYTAGANGSFYTDYAPTITSYDYDAPLSEAGDPGSKFAPFQKLIAKYTHNPRIRPIKPSKKSIPTAGIFTESLALCEALEEITHQRGTANVPPTMEELAPDTTGFIYYKKHLAGPLSPTPLRLAQVNDYVQVYLDQNYLGHRWRDDGTHPFEVSCSKYGAELELLVENAGRINYGPYLGLDKKGIAGFVALELQIQTGWEYRTLPLNSPPKNNFGLLDLSQSGAVFHRGSFEVTEIGETFVDNPGEKGVMWINGFNLGRYWMKGPQKRLYVPSPILHKGINEIVIFEMEKLFSQKITFSAEPNFGESVED